ncbi:MAG: SdiA-regulated domain-containing protein [Ferruginibacter sp.]|nr:SdiA-regulated domain-containing protein [Chitinophagaceae bacterium]
MRFLNFPAKLIPGALFLAVLAIACRPKVKTLKSPPHYNFSQAAVYKLDMKLKEISGIAWDPKTKIFFAINDEKGSLFYLDKDMMIPPAEYSFAGSGDYEDLTIMHGIPYILRSDGMITKFIRTDSAKIYGVEAGEIDLEGSNDFESMYFDPGRNALVVICKNCAEDDEKSVSAYAFYPDSIGFVKTPIFVIDAGLVDKMSPHKASKFQPSAAAIHPILQKLFIISSASSQLVIADLSGNVQGVYQLSKKLFPQPEGISFEQDGDMYISNEGVGGKGSVMKFDYSETIGKTELSKAGYDFAQPDEKMELGRDLKEISGLSFITGKNILVAQNDEKGAIFTVDFKNKSNEYGKVRFSGKGDYEDIVHTDSAEYLLVSTGGLVKVLTEDSVILPKEFTLGIEGKNEFETLYRDVDGSLVLLCKECDHEKDKIRAAYRFDPVTETFSTKPIYQIDIGAIQSMLNDDKAEFKPSAAGVNPVTGKLFVIASVGKLLVIVGTDGKVEQAIKLDPLLYNQPEGLTFAPNGDLYISNEGGEGVGRIFKFNYKKN